MWFGCYTNKRKCDSLETKYKDSRLETKSVIFTAPQKKKVIFTELWGRLGVTVPLLVTCVCPITPFPFKIPFSPVEGGSGSSRWLRAVSFLSSRKEAKQTNEHGRVWLTSPVRGSRLTAVGSVFAGRWRAGLIGYRFSPILLWRLLFYLVLNFSLLFEASRRQAWGEATQKHNAVKWSRRENF